MRLYILCDLIRLVRYGRWLRYQKLEELDQWSQRCRIILENLLELLIVAPHLRQQFLLDLLDMSRMIISSMIDVTIICRHAKVVRLFDCAANEVRVCQYMHFQHLNIEQQHTAYVLPPHSPQHRYWHQSISISTLKENYFPY